MQPGDWLNKAQFDERFGISREAGRGLEGKGVLRSQPCQSFYISRVKQREIVDVHEAKDGGRPDCRLGSGHQHRRPQKPVGADLGSIDETDLVAVSVSLLEFRLRMCTHVYTDSLPDLGLCPTKNSTSAAQC